MSAVDKDKIKVAFISQPLYLRCFYEDGLDAQYDVFEFPQHYGLDLDRYRPLIDFNADVNIFFEAECIPNEVLTSLKGKKIAICVEPIPKYVNGKVIKSKDMKRRLAKISNLKKNDVDYLFHYDPSSVNFLRERSFKIIDSFNLPIAVNTYKPLDLQKKWDLFFIGRSTDHREDYLGHIKHNFNMLHIAHGVFGNDLVQFINQSKMAVNLHCEKTLSYEPRMQLYMACRIAVMSEPLSSNDLFIPGKHYIEFRSKSEFWGKFEYYLKHEKEREQIAMNGYELILKELDSKKIFSKLVEDVLNGRYDAIDTKVNRKNCWFPFRLRHLKGL
jgi:spore maturation protein CgeB